MPSRALPEHIRGLSFDFANTLYPLNSAESLQTVSHLHRFLERRLGRKLPADTLHDLYVEIRERQFAENRLTLKENDFPARIREMIERVDSPPLAALVADAIEAYADGFIETMTLSEGASEAILALADRFEGRIAVCSNFIIRRAIVEPLRRDGLLPFLRGVVVSCDVGFVKPHPLMFQTVCNILELSPEEIAHVGDDLDADIVGGRRNGMYPIYTTQLCPPVPEDLIRNAAPSYTIGSLAELVSMA